LWRRWSYADGVVSRRGRGWGLDHYHSPSRRGTMTVVMHMREVMIIVMVVTVIVAMVVVVMVVMVMVAMVMVAMVC